MINEDLIYSTTVSFLNTIFDNLFFHIAYQDNALPEKPFGNVYIVSQNDVDSRKKYFDKENPREEILTFVTILMQIEIVSSEDNVLGLISKVRQTLRSDKALYHFKSNGFNIRKLGDVISLPDKVNDEWIYRRTFDITLEVKQSDVFDVDYILEVDIDRV